jgi:hypothetical protein
VYSKSHGTANVDLSASSNSKLSCNPIAYFYTEDCVCGCRIAILRKERRKQLKKKKKKGTEAVPTGSCRVARALQELTSLNYPQTANTKLITALTQYQQDSSMDLTFRPRYLNRFSEYKDIYDKKRYRMCKTIEKPAVIVSQCEAATLSKNRTVLISTHDTIVGM